MLEDGQLDAAALTSAALEASRRPPAHAHVLSQLGVLLENRRRNAHGGLLARRPEHRELAIDLGLGGSDQRVELSLRRVARSALLAIGTHRELGGLDLLHQQELAVFELALLLFEDSQLLLETLELLGNFDAPRVELVLGLFGASGHVRHLACEAPLRGVQGLSLRFQLRHASVEIAGVLLVGEALGTFWQVAEALVQRIRGDVELLYIEQRRKGGHPASVTVFSAGALRDSPRTRHGSKLRTGGSHVIDSPSRILIADASIVSMDAALGDLHGDILIENGSIEAIGLDLGAVDAERIDARGRIVIPGLVDAHRHVWQTPLRSVTADWSLANYVTGIRTVAAPVFRAEDIYAAQLAGALEMLNAGITTVVDYSHNLLSPDHAWEAIRGLEDAGIRALWCAGFNVPPGTDSHFRDSAGMAAFLREVAKQRFTGGGGRLTLGIAPEELGIGAAADVEQQYRLARELGARISHHVHSARFGRDPLEIAKVLGPKGLLGPDVLLVHMNFTSDDEWRQVADSGASVVFTPETELQMGMGFPSTRKARSLGIHPSIGADIVSNNGGDLFFQLRLALQTERALANEPAIASAEVIQGTPISAREALAWGTLHGAEASGMADRIGCLAPGKAADLVILDTEDISMLGWAGQDPAAHVVLQAHPGIVDSVMVDGCFVKRAGSLLADLGPVRRAMAETTAHVAGAIEERGGFGVPASGDRSSAG
jgi:5-methylthioadenosine/S-adenosylhomocysteine deaminase